MPFIEASKGGGTQRTNGRIVMATVKGDVHDIGKNIVGVVLQCNNFEVIDLGVMVPCEKILETARREQADFIGLSGLITPSLDEMVHVAQGDAAAGLRGAAADRRRHDFPGAHLGEDRAAVHRRRVIYVKDASRAVGVCQTLSQPQQRAAFIAKIDVEHAAAPRAARRQEGEGAGAVARRGARQPPRASTGAPYAARRRALPGVQRFDDYPLSELLGYIDWMPFFNAWEFSGKFPDILTDPVVGEAASNLYADARRMLKQLIAERWLRVRAVLGLFPANAVGDDVELYADEARAQVLATLQLPAPAEGQARRPAARVPGGLRGARSRAACPTTSAPSR